jgi:hypothetical protein
LFVLIVARQGAAMLAVLSRRSAARVPHFVSPARHE